MKPERFARRSRGVGTFEDRPFASCDTCTLDALGCGLPARIESLAGAPRVVRRLAALGLRPSAECEVLSRSHLGGPIRLRAGAIQLMVRASEAVGIVVRPAPQIEPTDVVPPL